MKFNITRMNLKQEKAFITYFHNREDRYSKPCKSLNLLEARAIRLNSSFEFSKENIKKIKLVNNQLKTLEAELISKAKQWKTLALENNMGEINLSIEILAVIFLKYESLTSTPIIVKLYGDKFRWWAFDEKFEQNEKQQNPLFDFEFCYSLDILINHTQYFTWEDLVSIDNIEGSIEIFQGL